MVNTPSQNTLNSLTDNQIMKKYSRSGVSQENIDFVPASVAEEP